ARAGNVRSTAYKVEPSGAGGRRHLSERGGEGAQVLDHITHEAIDQFRPMFRKELGELRETEIRIVEGVDNTAPVAHPPFWRLVLRCQNSHSGSGYEFWHPNFFSNPIRSLISGHPLVLIASWKARWTWSG